VIFKKPNIFFLKKSSLLLPHQPYLYTATTAAARRQARPHPLLPAARPRATPGRTPPPSRDQLRPSSGQGSSGQGQGGEARSRGGEDAGELGRNEMGEGRAAMRWARGGPRQDGRGAGGDKLGHVRAAATSARAGGAARSASGGRRCKVGQRRAALRARPGEGGGASLTRGGRWQAAAAGARPVTMGIGVGRLGMTGGAHLHRERKKAGDRI
jgi:hypothetical protein